MRTIRYIWVVPVQEYVEQAEEIHRLQTQLRGRLDTKRERRDRLMNMLVALHADGVELRMMIRGKGPFIDEYKARCQKVEREVEGLLRAEAPTQLGRFRSDIAQSQQVHQPGAGARQAKWGNWIDRRLDNLQAIIDVLSGADSTPIS